MVLHIVSAQGGAERGIELLLLVVLQVEGLQGAHRPVEQRIVQQHLNTQNLFVSVRVWRERDKLCVRTSTIVSRASWELLITSMVFSQHLTPETKFSQLNKDKSFKSCSTVSFYM